MSSNLYLHVLSYYHYIKTVYIQIKK